MTVVEMFKMLQGEGVNMGRFATLLRLGGCNLSCSFCDTKYALGNAGTEMTIAKVAARIGAIDHSPNLLVFTGGEPMLQTEELFALVVMLQLRMQPTIAIETNGVIPPNEFVYNWVDHVAISPKLQTTCEGGYDIRVLQAWARLPHSMEFKFVVTCIKDLWEIAGILKNLPNRLVILQPNGQTDDYPLALRQLYEWTDSWALKHRVKILPQLHRVMWGKDARGI